MSEREDQRRAHLAAIAAAPWDDELPRLAYSDWLIDHDEPEEAGRQRQWVPSARWLRGFMGRWQFGREHHRDDEHGYAPPGSMDAAMEEVLAEAARGGNGLLVAMGIDLHSSDELGGDEKLFWQHVEVLSGKRFGEAHREAFVWPCSC